MSRDTWWGKTLRFIGIVLMALTSGFTLLGGIGTTCAALFPTRWDSMTPLAPFQWLYILFVLMGIGLGVWGIQGTIKLMRGTPDAYMLSLLVLTAGAVIGGFHIYISRWLRGKSMPVDAVVYMTLLTLVVFLLLRIPFLWQGANFEKGNQQGNRAAGGTAAILLGLMTLTVQYTMGSTHTWNGINYANAFSTVMTMTGIVLLLFGAGSLIGVRKFQGNTSQLIVQKKNA